MWLRRNNIQLETQLELDRYIIAKFPDCLIDSGLYLRSLGTKRFTDHIVLIPNGTASSSTNQFLPDGPSHPRKMVQSNGNQVAPISVLAVKWSLLGYIQKRSKSCLPSNLDGKQTQSSLRLYRRSNRY